MADSKLPRHQYHHSMFSKEAAAKSLVLIATQGFIYLCSLLLYLEVICGNEKLCAATLISSTLHLGAEMKLCEKSREYPSLRNIKQVCSQSVIYASELQNRL